MHRLLGLLDGVRQNVEETARRDAVRLQVLERLDGRRTRGDAADAEPVGDGEQTGPGVGGVLVGLADETGVGTGGVTDAQRTHSDCHGGVLPFQLTDEEGDQVTPCGEVGLGPHPEGADLLGRGPRVQRAHVPDADQWHPQPPQPGDEPGLLQLVRRVEAVAGDRVDAGGRQETQLVVETQRLRRQPGHLRERPDGQQPHAHPSSYRAGRPVTPMLWPAPR